jgi:hypothetical protein
MYDCTQGKKVTCLLKPGMKTGKNHSLNDANYAELEQILLFSVNWGKQVCNMWKVAIHRYSCLLKEKNTV